MSAVTCDLQCLPITTLEIIDDLLFIGESTYISAVDLNGHDGQSQSSGHLGKLSLFKDGYYISGIKSFRNFIFVYANRFGRLLRRCDGAGEGRSKGQFPVEPIISSSGPSTMDFHEWIQGASWLEDEVRPEIAVLTALNCLSVWTLMEDQLQLKSTHQYKNKSILYSGYIYGKSFNDLLVFSGTVYREILIWTPVGDCGFKNLFRLEGHDGVIFSITFIPEKNLLLSTSDDRSVRVWRFEEKGQICNSPQDVLKGQDEVDCICQDVLYGHGARVWKSIFIQNDKIVSIGEDSVICLWNLDGSIFKKWSAHSGASIWSCVFYHRKNILFTGGGNGSIAKWNFDSEEKTQLSIPLNLKDSKDYPRNVIIYNSEYILIICSSGHVMSQSTKTSKSTILFSSETIRGRSIFSLSKDKKKLIVCSSDIGHIIIFEITIINDILASSIKWELGTNDIILKIQWIDNESFIYSTLDRLKLYKVLEEDACSYSVTLSKNYLFNAKRPGITSVLLINDSEIGQFILVGDEIGGLWLFKVDTNTSDSKDSGLISSSDYLKGIHGRYGCTSIKWNELQKEFITVGRNGLLKTFKVEDEKLIETNNEKVEFEWISGLYSKKFDSNLGYLIIGFMFTEFVIYSWNEKRILAKIQCGGGHRQWDFYFDDDDSEHLQNLTCYFAFIRDKRIFHSSINLTETLAVYIKEGTHSRLTNCGVQFYFQNEEKIYFITGGEDCTIRINQYDLNSKKYKPFGIYQRHCSSVKSIKMPKLANSYCRGGERAHVVSCGGRSQIILWELDKDLSISTAVNQDNDNDQLRFREITSRFVGTGPNDNVHSISSDQRIMDIDVFYSNSILYISCACSDGKVRIIKYKEEEKNRRKKLVQIYEFVGNSHCIMKTKYFPASQIVMGVTSNGYLFVWRFDKDSEGEMNVKSIWSKRIHPCSITAFDGEETSIYNFLLATGGDNGLICVHKLVFNESQDFDEILIISDDHDYDHKPKIYELIADSFDNICIPRSTITQVSFQNSKNCGDTDEITLLALSTDQILLQWTISGYSTRKLLYCNSCVPDPSSFIFLQHIDSILCFGHGYKLIPFKSLVDGSNKILRRE